MTTGLIFLGFVGDIDYCIEADKKEQKNILDAGGIAVSL